MTCSYDFDDGVGAALLEHPQGAHAQGAHPQGAL